LKKVQKNTMLFGAPDADSDLLLKDCLVEGQVGRYSKPILIGRWGTGKSANLISRARQLENILEEVDPLSKRAWYIKEQHISTNALFELHKQHSEASSEGYFISQIQEVWKSEIKQRVIRVLILLSESKKIDIDRNTEYWKAVRSFHKNEFVLESMWGCVNDILSIVFNQSNSNTTEGFQEYLRLLRSERINNSIQRCILELEATDQVVPVIGVEPIETPASDLDARVNMAECVIAALLNVYRNDYIINDRQRVQVYLSLPWNRTANKKINLPQHSKPYMEEIRWTKENLREFIRRRIEWEMNGRMHGKLHFRAGADAWDAIFPASIENKSCSGAHRFETSFDYVLRHTQWRARDVQTVTRDCVITFCNENDISVGNFFKNRETVPQTIVRNVVASFAQETASLRLEEARRRFAGTNKDFFEQGAIETALRGLRVPFSDNELQKRLNPKGNYQEYSEALSAIWESGIIGIHISCADEDFCKVIESSYTQSKSRHITNRSAHHYFIFQYNSDKTPQHIREGFEGRSNGMNLNYILHPCFFEALESHISSAIPLGV